LGFEMLKSQGRNKEWGIFMDPQMAMPMQAVPQMPMWAIVVWLIVYLFAAFCVAKIAVKTGLPFGKSFLFAILPILNIYLLVKMAGKPGWWLLLMLIPFVNFVILIILWVEIMKKCGKPSWWVVLLFIPIVNFIIFLMLAFGKESAPATA